MRIGIMQPYFLPYIGYFQLINAVDQFVVYDNIKYTKKGWINRNRVLMNGKDQFITLPLKKDSDYLPVNERYLSDHSDVEIQKTFRKLKENYVKAPNFGKGIALAEEILFFDERNLFEFIYHSLRVICTYLEISTPLIVSSSIQIDLSLKGEEKVLAYCKALGATDYLNPIGGLELYSFQNFQKEGLDLGFLKSTPVKYKQFTNEYIPWLSIIDVIMFNQKPEVQEMITNKYEIIKKKHEI